MIRAATTGDQQRILGIATSSGLFKPDELEIVDYMIQSHFQQPGEDQSILLVDCDQAGTVVGVAYCTPEEIADGVWNLLMIAFDAKVQRQGRGAAMLQHVEQMLKRNHVRMLLIETAATDEFEPARDFYRKHHYEQEGRIRDYYEPGMDKVIFRKLL